MTFRFDPIRFAARTSLALVALLSAVGVASAQGGSPARPAAASGPTAAAARPAGPLPAGKMAIIDFNSFNERIFDMKRAIDSLNSRFDPQTKELQALRDRMTGLENQAKAGTASPQQVEQIAQQYEQLKKEFERKNEDLTANGRKAYSDAMSPVRLKIYDALTAFARQKGIIAVIDIGAAYQNGSIFYVANGLDITEEFIAEYNKANPQR